MLNSNTLICQCSGMGKVIDATNIQRITVLLLEADKAFKESKRQQDIAKELTLKAIDMLLKEDIDIISIMEAFKDDSALSLQELEYFQ